jgi:hypothetical protein
MHVNALFLAFIAILVPVIRLWCSLWCPLWFLVPTAVTILTTGRVFSTLVTGRVPVMLITGSNLLVLNL